ncbi:MAG: DegV family protein [Lachnospiraceae bacterium]
MALRLITDSACDLPKTLTEKYGIEVISTPVLIDGKDYFDGDTIEAKEFYKILRKKDKTISTYHINTYMFLEHFEPYAKRGDELIYICFSTGIAGTFNAASQAKAELLETYPDFDLTIIDSKCASIGFGLVVMYAGMMYQSNAGKQEIIDAVYYHCKHMKHVFTVDTLEYLLKGGRISKTSAIAGGLLGIRPIIVVDENGSLKAIEKVRGRKKSLSRLIEYTGEHGTGLSGQVIGIVHGDDREAISTVQKNLEEQYGVLHVVSNYVGCAIGAHTGPGIVGITFLDEPSPYVKL